MATIKAESVMKLTNSTDKTIRFIPYKENFATAIPAGKSVSLVAKTVGQYFYYMKQAETGLTVEVDASAAADVVIETPAKITLENNTDKSMFFVPYRENFQVEVKQGESYDFTADTAGQVLYYLAQDVDGELDVTQIKA